MEKVGVWGAGDLVRSVEETTREIRIGHVETVSSKITQVLSRNDISRKKPYVPHI
jgi:hypothetical protein